jgi:hypothetical protein
MKGLHFRNPLGLSFPEFGDISEHPAGALNRIVAQQF